MCLKWGPGFVPRHLFLWLIASSSTQMQTLIPISLLNSQFQAIDGSCWISYIHVFPDISMPSIASPLSSSISKRETLLGLSGPQFQPSSLIIYSLQSRQNNPAAHSLALDPLSQPTILAMMAFWWFIEHAAFFLLCTRGFYFWGTSACSFAAGSFPSWFSFLQKWKC